MSTTPPPLPEAPRVPAVRIRTLVTAALITLAVVGLVFLLHAILDIVMCSCSPWWWRRASGRW